MTKGRMEAFSDGVIAIAITLLVLDLKVPSGRGGGLAHTLGEQWPAYAAYVVSFLTIGIIWINHHAALARMRLVDHSVLVLNLLLLLTIGVLPWSTALMAAYLRAGTGQHLAAAIYAGTLLAMSIVFYALQRHTLRSRPHLLHEQVGERERQQVDRRSRVGLVPYVLATAAAPLSAYLTLAICAAIAFYYALPSTSQALQES